jgi:CrcB protein
MQYLWVAIGGALGSMARYGISGWVSRFADGSFPFGTMAVNVSGAVLIGFLAALSLPDGRVMLRPSARLFAMTGICGGYTTFSTFSLETFNLMRDGEMLQATTNVLFSVVLCLIGLALGYALGVRIARGVA